MNKTTEDVIIEEEISKFFQRKVRPKLARLKEARTSAYKKSGFACFIIAALTATLLQKTGTNDEKFVLHVLAISGAICLIISKYFHRSFVKYFKDNVMKELITTIIPSSVYSPKEMIQEHHIRASSLVPRYDKIKGEDFVSGQINGQNIQFCELRAFIINYDNSKAKRETQVYQGIFFAFDLDKSLNQKTLVKTDFAENFFGKNVGRFFQKKIAPDGLELVQLESVEFEKKFVVFSNSQIKSRKCLTPKVLNRIVGFKIRHRKNIEVCIFDNKFYVSFKNSKDYFEPKLFGEVVDLSELKDVYQLIILIKDLQQCFDIIDSKDKDIKAA